MRGLCRGGAYTGNIHSLRKNVGQSAGMALTGGEIRKKGSSK